MDPFSKKDWYDIKAPSAFTVRNAGKTLVTRTQGTKVGCLFSSFVQFGMERGRAWASTFTLSS